MHRRQRPRLTRGLLGLCIVIASLIALPATSSAATYASETALKNETSSTARATFIYDPGPTKLITRAKLLSSPLVGYYTHSDRGFGKNFLAWAPTRTLDLGHRRWAYCPPASQSSSPLCQGPHAFDVVGNLVAGKITVVEHGGAFIALVCGNFSSNGSAGPAPPRITGVKYEDLNADGDRDPGEPGLAGWTIKLRRDGVVVKTTTTGAGGAYSFKLDANDAGIGPGRYTVEEVQKTGWKAKEAPGAIQVNPGIGSKVFAGNDFGNYRPATIRGHKFDDPDVDGIWDASDPGLGGWAIDLSGDATASKTTAADGSYSFSVDPGTYTLGETLKPGWRQTSPAAPGTHSLTVTSGQVVDGADFGNVCLGTVDVQPTDVTTGLPVPGVEVRIEEVSVPGILDNDPSLPRTTTGTPTFGDLLPGTYRVTVFLPDDLFTTDPDLTVVDGRFAVVKEIAVRPCETTEVPVDLYPDSTPGFVTGGSLNVPSGTGFATAGFEFMARGVDDERGTFEYHDDAAELRLHTRDVHWLYIVGDVAFVAGDVEVDGTSVGFLLRLEDAGEPGDSDRFELRLENGYHAGAGVTLDGGNIQVHGRR